MGTDPDIPFQDLTYRIIGCAMDVHNQLGPGFKEATYQRALSASMTGAGMSFEAERRFRVDLDGRTAAVFYADHLVEGRVIVEVKALSHLLTADELAQVITYLAAAELPVGILFNFGRPKLDYRRVLAPRKRDAWRTRIGRYARSTAR